MKEKRTLQERMTAISPYFRGIDMYNEALIVRVVYPNKWKAYNSSDGLIKAAPSENNENEIWYYANSKECDFDTIFDLIEETIKANNEIHLKLELLKTKIEELKGLFSQKPYEELTRMRFVFDMSAKKDKPKRKYTKRKKDALEAQDEATDPLSESIAEAQDNNPQEINTEEEKTS